MTIGKSDRKKLVKALTIIIIFIIAALSKTYNRQHVSKEAEGELIVHMIDVGQADSFLLVQGDQVALVDCGTRSSGKDVVAYLQRLGITKINYLFGTHPHDDHMGGMYDVITNFEIETIIIPEVKNGEVTANWYLKLMKEIRDGGYQVEHPRLDMVYHIGDADIKVIGPISKPVNNVNNYSIVLKVSFGEMDMIMTGDAEKAVEREILEAGYDIEAEILKLGHHGSDTSSSAEFLDAIDPEYALVSAGVGNQYDHPIESVMEEMEERDIKLYRTDESGTVILLITSDDVSFNCEPGDYLSGTQLEERSQK